MTNNFRRDTLPDLAFCLRIDRQDKVGMSFDVDKTRCDHKALCVNHLNSIGGERRGDCGNPAGCRGG